MINRKELEDEKSRVSKVIEHLIGKEGILDLIYQKINYIVK